jgi:hypothetical protein
VDLNQTSRIYNSDNIETYHSAFDIGTYGTMLLLLVAAFLAFTTACPPPLNSFKYLANDTHTVSEMISILLLPRNQSSILSRRWTEIVTMVTLLPSSSKATI